MIFSPVANFAYQYLVVTMGLESKNNIEFQTSSNGYFQAYSVMWTVKYNNMSINANLFYADFTKTQIQKVSIPYLTRTVTFALSANMNRLTLTC